MMGKGVKRKGLDSAFIHTILAISNMRSIRILLTINVSFGQLIMSRGYDEGKGHTNALHQHGALFQV